jgi:uroporphyrinogen decarboxylase
MNDLKARTLASFRFEEVRPTPYTVWYDRAAKEKLDEYHGDSGWQDRIHDHIVRICLDWRPRTFVAADRFLDVHGSLWKTGDPVHLVEPVLKQPDLSGFAIPSYVPSLRRGRGHLPSGTEWPQIPGKYSLSLAEAVQMLEHVGGSAFTEVDFGYGVLESAWMIRGYEEFLADLAAEPVFARRLLDMLVERHLELLDVILELPCDAVMLTDDFGDQNGVTIGPERWRAFVKPWLRTLYDRIHAAGRMAFHHTDGNVIDIVPDLIECGLDVLQSVQSEAMPVYELKRRYGADLRLWGGLGTQSVLTFGTPDAVRQEVRRLKRELGRGGGYVFSTSKPLTGDMPVENLVALVEESVADDA